MTPRRLAALLAVMVSLAAPAAADAGTLSRDGSVLVFSEADADFSANALKIALTSGGRHVFWDTSGDPITNSAADCDDDKSGGAFWYCSNVTAIRVTLGGGSDQFSATEGSPVAPAVVPITIDGGPGADTITGGDANDVLDGDVGADALNGGGGSDVVSYANHATGVTVNLGEGGAGDGAAEDGSPGARDTVNPADVEGVVGSEHGDSLTGGPGADILRAGAGADTIEARDGVADDVDCGADADNPLLDPVDTHANCDFPSPPGSAGDAGGPGDPGGPGGNATTPGPERILVNLGFGYSAGRLGTRLRRLFVRDIPAGSSLRVRCRTRRGRRCPRTRDLALTNAAGDIRIRRFEGKRLPLRAKLTIQVTQPDMIGAVERLTVRRGRAPRQTTLCLPLGAARPSAC